MLGGWCLSIFVRRRKRIQSDTVTHSSLLRNDDSGARTSALEDCLVSVAAALQSVGRKRSKPLLLRTDALLDQLAEDDEDDVAAWVSAEWAPEHAEAVAEAVEQLRMIGSASVTDKAANVVSIVL